VIEEERKFWSWSEEELQIDRVEDIAISRDTHSSGCLFDATELFFFNGLENVLVRPVIFAGPVLLSNLCILC
jgi:hypothetical protein